MTNSNQQFRDSVFYLLSTGLKFLIPLVTLPIFMLILTPADYGAMALAQVYGVFIAGVANFGMHISYERNYFQFSKNSLDLSKLFYSSILFVVFNLIIVGSLSYFSRDSLSSFMQIKGMGDLLFVVFVVESTNILIQYYMIQMRNGEKAKEYMFVEMSGTFLSVLVSLVFVMVFHAGVFGFVVGKLIVNVLMLAFLQARLLSVLQFALDVKMFTYAFKFSLPLFPRLVLNVISTQFDKFLLGLLSNAEGVGIYNIAQKIAYGIFAFMVSVQNVFIPRAYKMMFDDGASAGRNVGLFVTPFAYVCISVAMVVALFSDEFIHFFTPQQYHGMYGVVVVLSMFYGLQFINRVTSMQFLYSKKTGLISVLSLITLLSGAAVSIPLILKWGAIGAACGALCVGVISVIISFYLGQKLFRIEWEKKSMGMIFGFFLVSASAALVLSFLNVDFYVRLIFKLFLMMLFVFLGIKCGWLKHDQWKAFKDIILRK